MYCHYSEVNADREIVMKKKTLKTYQYQGLGFPIELKNVEMLFIENEWHPKIDVKHVAEITIKKLITQHERLTGNQLKFIRRFLGMPLRDFAKKVVNVSHTAVNKWEKCEDKVTNMDINIEKILRLYLYEQVSMKTVKQKRDFYKVYLTLKNISLSNSVGHIEVQCSV